MPLAPRLAEARHLKPRHEQLVANRSKTLLIDGRQGDIGIIAIASLRAQDGSRVAWRVTGIGELGSRVG